MQQRSLERVVGGLLVGSVRNAVGVCVRSAAVVGLGDRREEGSGMRRREFGTLHSQPRRNSSSLNCRIPISMPPSMPRTRDFHTSRHTLKEHHFDTLRVVQRLKEEGLTEQQAEGIMKVMSEVIDESTQNLARTMVLKEEQEKITYTQKVDFAKLRSELHSQQNADFLLTRNEYDRLTAETSKLSSRLRDEISRAQNAFRLDLNLEKGRIREEASAHELKIKETDTRIEAEVGTLRGVLEGVKFSTLQWLIGVCTGTAALILGIWRLLM